MEHLTLILQKSVDGDIILVIPMDKTNQEFQQKVKFAFVLRCQANGYVQAIYGLIRKHPEN